MAGLALANELRRTVVRTQVAGSGNAAAGDQPDLERAAPVTAARAVAAGPGAADQTTTEQSDRRAAPVAARVRLPLPAPPRPPDLARHVLRTLPIDEVFAHLNAQMLYGKHLGVRGSVRRLLADGDVRTTELIRRVEALQDTAAAQGWLAPAAVFSFFRAVGRGDTVVLHQPSGVECAQLPFVRQRKAPELCAADWVQPELATGDAVALFVVTAGGEVRMRADALRQQGRLLDSVALQALALETAEAAAEWLHRRLRELWGFPDPPELTMEERFRARYRGIRLSFGYPACPGLEPQAAVFRLLRPEEIGVRLTEGLMMDPEASVSAVVFHHPEARYYA